MTQRLGTFLAVLSVGAIGAITACGADDSAAHLATAATTGTGGTGGPTGPTTTGPTATSSSTTGATGGSGGASSGSSATGVGGRSSGGSGGAGGSIGTGGAPPSDAGAPGGFWDPSGIPPAQNVMMFKFLNRTNGKYPDSQVFWSFKGPTGDIVHSIAEQATYDMPANASGRLYLYLGDPKSMYFDFIEFTIGPTRFNGNTTRVDAFGLKIAMRLHCADGFDVAVGEDYETFAEDRAVTFQKFLDDVPAEFKPLAQLHAPYRIVEPGAVDFKAGGLYEHYYDAFVDQIWSANGITVPKPGPNASGLGAYPNLSAAIFRHVGAEAGSFTPDGKLLNKNLWSSSAGFYSAAPANYYARFWHTHGLGGKAYGFPYDDVGGYSSYVSHDNPQYLLIAIGW
jgi:hypothetical protein